MHWIVQKFFYSHSHAHSSIRKYIYNFVLLVIFRLTIKSSTEWSVFCFSFIFPSKITIFFFIRGNISYGSLFRSFFFYFKLEHHIFFCYFFAFRTIFREISGQHSVRIIFFHKKNAELTLGVWFDIRLDFGLNHRFCVNVLRVGK